MTKKLVSSRSEGPHLERSAWGWSVATGGLENAEDSLWRTKREAEKRLRRLLRQRKP